MLLVCLPYGAGYHQWDVRLASYYRIEFVGAAQVAYQVPENMRWLTSYKFLYVSFVLYDLAIVGAKVSILLQLSAIFSGSKRGYFYWASMALIIINIVFYIALSFALIFQCKPLEKAWNPTVEGTCVNQDALLTSSGPFNIVSDFLIFVLPLWAIWKLQLPLRRRLEVSGAFAIALFGCICSAVRLVYSNRLQKSGDATWVIMQNQLWANAEITAGILIASIFVLPRLIRQWLGKDNSYAHSGYDKYSSQNTRDNNASNVRQNTVWASRHSRPRSIGFSRDSYLELDENVNVHRHLPSKSSREPLSPRVKASPSDKPLSTLDGAKASFDRSGEVEAGDSGIVKTVEIELTEERVPAGTAEPAVIPGAVSFLHMPRKLDKNT